MNSNRRLASGLMAALLCVQCLLAIAAVAAVALKDRPNTPQRAYQTAMASQDVAWR